MLELVELHSYLPTPLVISVVVLVLIVVVSDFGGPLNVKFKTFMSVKKLRKVFSKVEEKMGK